MTLVFNAVIVSTVVHSKGENLEVVLVIAVMLDNQGQKDLHNPLNNTITSI